MLVCLATDVPSHLSLFFVSSYVHVVLTHAKQTRTDCAGHFCSQLVAVGGGKMYIMGCLVVLYSCFLLCILSVENGFSTARCTVCKV